MIRHIIYLGDWSLDQAAEKIQKTSETFANDWGLNSVDAPIIVVATFIARFILRDTRTPGFDPKWHQKFCCQIWIRIEQSLEREDQQRKKRD